MNQQQGFDRIIASLHEATFDETYWPAVSLLIDETFSSKGNALLVGQRDGDTVRVGYQGLYWRGERQEDLERQYLETYHPVDERVARLRQLPDSRVVPVRELYSTEELKTSPTYNEMLPRLIGQNSVTVRLDLAPGSHLTFCLGEPMGGAAWDSSRLEMVEHLLPHVRLFARVRRALFGAEALGVALDELLNSTRLGVIHLDRRGRIVTANDRARNILAKGTGLRVQGGELVPWLPGHRYGLERLLTGALPANGAQPVGGSMVVRRPSGLPLILHVTPLSVPRMAFSAVAPGALVMIVDTAVQPRLHAGRVSAALGLTPTEGRVAASLARGRTVQEIASAMDRREGTIRTHVKNIHRKLGLSRRADLVRMVLTADTVLDFRR